MFKMQRKAPSHGLILMTPSTPWMPSPAPNITYGLTSPPCAVLTEGVHQSGAPGAVPTHALTRLTSLCGAHSHRGFAQADTLVYKSSC